MRRRVGLSLVALAVGLGTGCSAHRPVPPPQTQPSPPPVAQAPAVPATPDLGPVPIPADRILLQFEKIDCVCGLANVEIALLEIPSVQSLDWNLDQASLWLNFTDARRPTDQAIRDALQYQSLKLLHIYRPHAL